MAESLLKAALKVSTSKKKAFQYSLEEEELCLAWLNSEVALHQVATVLSKKTGQQVYVFLARCSRQIFMKAQVKK